MSQQRLATADAARQQATSQLLGGITGVAGAGLMMAGANGEASPFLQALTGN